MVPIQFQLTNMVQQSFLDGIYKPISNKILASLQMASLSPFPQLHFCRVQIYGHSSVQSSFTFKPRTTKLADLALQVQEDWTGATVIPQNLPSHILQEKFTSPTWRVIFRYSFAKISLITYSQIQVRLKSQFFKEGIRMCEFSRRNMVKKVCWKCSFYALKNS